MTRSEYMAAYSAANNEAKRERLHREYYAQFVTPTTRNNVMAFIGRDRLRQSTDKHFNDIPLRTWNSLPIFLKPNAMKEQGDYLTPAGKVCILKEAARQLIEKEA